MATQKVTNKFHTQNIYRVVYYIYGLALTGTQSSNWNPEKLSVQRTTIVFSKSSQNEYLYSDIFAIEQFIDIDGTLTTNVS